VRPALEGTGDLANVEPTRLQSGLWLLPGSIDLGAFEDALAAAWPPSLSGDAAALRATTAVQRAIAGAARFAEADVVLVDAGANLGAINRAALLSADHVLMAQAVDLPSLKGLAGLGHVLRRWRDDWQGRVVVPVPDRVAAPAGAMHSLGYVVLQPQVRLDRPVTAYGRWRERIPVVFADAVVGAAMPGGDRPYEIATLRHYRSLLPLARDARKPMFDLRAADGALGSLAGYVQQCHHEYRALAQVILDRLGVQVPAPA
jgi:hypothetical protein